ncbi:MAG TPA: ABC transporter ATP-binding protein, partial [Desulfobacterales bacterium]|nr:ABC transporter ATP-binding protein [Desulfobacterales bacterium]
MQIVVVDRLVKYYGDFHALKGISFSVEEGEVFGIIGPNGAGKTTTLRIIATLLKPSGGRVTVCGYDVVREADKVRRIISYLPEEAGAYRNLSGYEYLLFIARLYTRSKREAEDMVEEAIRISGLGDRIYDRIKTYSKGMKRRLLIARTLMVRPRLAILDEPTSGLDVLHALHVRRVIREYARSHGVTVLLSSHNMLEVVHVDFWQRKVQPALGFLNFHLGVAHGLQILG